MEANTSWKKNYFIILSGQTVSLIGSSAVQFALIWWLASETSSPAMLAIVGLMAFLPQIFVGPFAGVWIDRQKKRNVMIAADLFIGAVAACFAAFFFMGRPPYWTVCLVAGLRALGDAFHTPAAQAVVPLLVPREQLVKANAWSQFLQSGAYMLGPVLGAALYAALPMSWLLLTDFAGAIIACATLLCVRVPEPARTDAQLPHLWREMKAGAALLLRYRQLMWLILASTAAMVFFMPLSSYFPLMTSDYFALSAWHGSLVEFMFAAGILIASAVMGGITLKQDTLSPCYWGILGLGVTSLLCGLLPPRPWCFWIYVGLCTLMGGCSPVYNIPLMAYMQGNIPQEAQGRVFSLTGSLMSLSMPVGLLLSGPICERTGVAMWFLITGAAICLLVAAFRMLAAGDARKRKHSPD